MKKLLACALCIGACFAAVRAATQQPFRMAAYRFPPHGICTEVYTQYLLSEFWLTRWKGLEEANVLTAPIRG